MACSPEMRGQTHDTGCTRKSDLSAFINQEQSRALEFPFKKSQPCLWQTMI